MQAYKSFAAALPPLKDGDTLRLQLPASEDGRPPSFTWTDVPADKPFKSAIIWTEGALARAWHFDAETGETTELPASEDEARLVNIDLPGEPWTFEA